MLKRFAFVSLFALAASVSFGAIVQQNNFTSAENGTLPGDLGASYDAGVDAIVVPLATMSPAPPADHAGGDGFVCRVGDLGAGGGGYNWIFSNAAATQTDTKISAWFYIDWVNWDATPLERDYLLMSRIQVNRDPQLTTTRQGYWFLVTSNSSWSGVTPNPTNKKAFLMKRVGTTNAHTVIGTESAADVDTGWHLLALEIVGTTLKGYVDGALVCQGTDSTYADGYAAAGFYEDNGAAINLPYAAAIDNLVYETATSDVADWSMY